MKRSYHRAKIANTTQNAYAMGGFCWIYLDYIPDADAAAAASIAIELLIQQKYTFQKRRI